MRVDGLCANASSFARDAGGVCARGMANQRVLSELREMSMHNRCAPMRPSKEVDRPGRAAAENVMYPTDPPQPLQNCPWWAPEGGGRCVFMGRRAKALRCAVAGGGSGAAAKVFTTAAVETRAAEGDEGGPCSCKAVRCAGGRDAFSLGRGLLDVFTLLRDCRALPNPAGLLLPSFLCAFAGTHPATATRYKLGCEFIFILCRWHRAG
ncbi:hypothetical protein TraAM80_10098 [Trypanosoma rangeli]|uniref:Uncharacterized protein n=1 Tax=Trypanosoma rangeli TaxID=5698 RepID=A0A422MRT0_TRYRA|nr:uncharacterized protein TraAM80_10098 [Trypanosoma rangeli]RNE95919.1 hypothetical protein TraAM80_10098 [Trypanosoma rangeli]|eukprot:RNE95919.1 hypothetical protein TraAM80_10098 [Trypanosoma rangeli]